jgi:hypothetical protein
MVSEGEVVMKSNKEDIRDTVVIRGGTMSCVPEFNPPNPVVPISPAEMKRFSDSTVVAGNVIMDKTEVPQQIQAPAPAVAARSEVVEQLAESVEVELPPVEQEPVSALTPVTINVVFP